MFALVRDSVERVREGWNGWMFANVHLLSTIATGHTEFTRLTSFLSVDHSVCETWIHKMFRDINSKLKSMTINIKIVIL